MTKTKEKSIEFSFIEATMIMQALIRAHSNEREEADDQRLLGAYRSIFDKLKKAYNVPLEFPGS